MGEEIFIDSNIFLEIFLHDAKHEACKKFLKSHSDGEGVAVVTDFIVYTCILAVERSFQKTSAIQMVALFFNNYPRLSILRLSFDDFMAATEIMKTSALDFDDSLVIAAMKNYHIKKLASFDKHFDTIRGIERIKI